MAAEVSLGVITEQGDLGLGYEPVTAKEEKTVKENDANKGQKDEK